MRPPVVAVYDMLLPKVRFLFFCPWCVCFVVCVFVRGAVDMVEYGGNYNTQAEGKIEQRKHYLGIEDVETHIAQLLRNTKIIGKQSVSVSRFDELSVDEQLSFSPFLVDLRKRARLFQRIHTALMRQSRLQNCDSVIEDDDASIEEVEFTVVDNAAIEQQEKDFAISTNTRMTLALVKSMQSLCPGIFGALAGSLIELLCEILHLGLSQARVGSVDHATSASIHKYASEVVFNSNSNPEDRLQGVSL